MMSVAAAGSSSTSPPSINVYLKEIPPIKDMLLPVVQAVNSPAGELTKQPINTIKVRDSSSSSTLVNDDLKKINKPNLKSASNPKPGAKKYFKSSMEMIKIEPIEINSLTANSMQMKNEQSFLINSTENVSHRSETIFDRLNDKVASANQSVNQLSQTNQSFALSHDSSANSSSLGINNNNNLQIMPNTNVAGFDQTSVWTTQTFVREIHKSSSKPADETSIWTTQEHLRDTCKAQMPQQAHLNEAVQLHDVILEKNLNEAKQNAISLQNLAAAAAATKKSSNLTVSRTQSEKNSHSSLQPITDVSASASKLDDLYSKNDNFILKSAPGTSFNELDATQKVVSLSRLDSLNTTDYQDKHNNTNINETLIDSLENFNVEGAIKGKTSKTSLLENAKIIESMEAPSQSYDNKPEKEKDKALLDVPTKENTTINEEESGEYKGPQITSVASNQSSAVSATTSSSTTSSSILKKNPSSGKSSNQNSTHELHPQIKHSIPVLSSTTVKSRIEQFETKKNSIMSFNLSTMGSLLSSNGQLEAPDAKLTNGHNNKIVNEMNKIHTITSKNAYFIS